MAGERVQTSRRGGRSRADWERLVSEYETSGMGRKAFCAERSVAVTSLDYWRRKLKAESSSIGFVELGAVAAEPSSGWDIELALGDGVVLRLSRG